MAKLLPSTYSRSMSVEPIVNASSMESARSALTDEEVVTRVASGETGLFEIIMRRYNQRLFRIVRSIVGTDHEAEDAVQEVYLSAYSHLGQFAGHSQFSTWLTRIAINEALARRRRRARRSERELNEQDGSMLASAPARTPEEEANRGEIRRVLEAAIDALPTMYRVVFVMREMEQMSTAETASALEIAEIATKVRLYRATGLLRHALSTRTHATFTDVYPFLGLRCDRIVRAVMSALASSAGPASWS